MIMLAQHGPTSHQAIMDSLERFGEKVISHFKARETALAR
jgi:hypothetical protein